MKLLARYLMIGIILGVFLSLISTPATAQSDGNQKLKSMISELEKKIEDADKRMIAHPTFLEELKNLVEKYRSQLRELYFRDTFKDGDFEKNPKWIVKSGAFSVTDAGRLSSVVSLKTDSVQEKEPSKQNKSLEQEAVGILLDSLFGAEKSPEPVESKPQKLPEPVQPAVIYTKKVFPPTFEMNMRFKTSPHGEMALTLLGTKKLLPRYRLKINANHSEKNPIEIIRESNSRSFVVGASNKFPKINDKKFHTLSWIRYSNGAMNILIDGDLVLQTYEVYYRDDFTGFEISNNGGSHEWDSFKIFKAKKPKGE